MRRLLLPLLLACAHGAAATPRTVRVAVPDLAGMLFPEQTRRMAFGTASMGVTSSYATQIAPGDTLPPCDSTIASLCLDLVWVSEYEFDPFVLMAFESAAAVGSTTFDVNLSTAASLLPTIQGHQNVSGSVANSSTSTLWRFYAPRDAEALDVVLRLRQQSQLRAARDQLVIRVAASLEDAQQARTVLEAFSVYGNQRISHSVTFASTTHVRVDLAISRSTAAPDVVLEDAYPLMPLITTSSSGLQWRLVDADCLTCSATLLGCASPSDINDGVCAFDTSTSLLPACLRSSIGLTTDWFKGMVAGDGNVTYSLADPLRQCFSTATSSDVANDTVSREDAAWWNVSRALSCLVSRQCPFGPLHGVLSTTHPNAKMVQLFDSTPLMYRLQWRREDGISGHFVMTFGANSATNGTKLTLTTSEIFIVSTEIQIANVIRAGLAGLESVAVTATKTFVADDVFCDISISYLVIPDFSLTFLPSTNVSWELTQIGVSRGAPWLRVSDVNKTQLQLENKCDECASELDPCRHDDTCQLVVLPCVERVFASLDPANASVDSEFGMYRLDFLNPVVASCFSGVPTSAWNPIRRAIVCVSQNHCAVGASNTSWNEQTFVRLGNGTQVVAVPVHMTQDNSTVVTLAISSGGASFTFHSMVDKLDSFLRLFVLDGNGDVTIDSEPDSSDPSMIQLTITYANALMASNPSFNGTENLVEIGHSPTSGFLEFADATTFSLEKILSVIRSYLTASVDPAVFAAAKNHSWQLAPECIACQATFFGCLQSEVGQNACFYDNAASPLAQCIRKVISRKDIGTYMTNPSAQDKSWPISVDVTRCIQTTAALSGDTNTSHIAATTAISCFASTGCPFGPVDLVRDDRMVQLVASSYVYSMRIPAHSFRLGFSFVLGDYTVAEADVDSSESIRNALNTVLAPLGITVYVETSFADGEWTLTLNFFGVVTSDFSVRLATNSTPSPLQIGQALLRPITRLILSPRLDSKVFRKTPHQNFTGNSSSGSGSDEKSTSSSGSKWDEHDAGFPGSQASSPATETPSGLLTFTPDCFNCDNVHLTACGRSQYCRTVVATCVSTLLKQYSFQSIAQTLPDGTSSVDLATMVRSCVTSASFFDWWEPLQRWLGCYATFRCPTTKPTTGRRSDAYLDLVRASLRVNTSVPHLWESGIGDFQLIAPTGSRMFGRSVVVESKNDLRTKVEYASQGTSTVTVTLDPVGPNNETSIHVEYDGPYLGEVPLLVSTDGYVLGSSSSAARLLLRSTGSGFDSEPWGLLSDKLADLLTKDPATPSTCGGCASTYLEQCRNTPNCKGYLLDCLTYSIENNYAEALEMDRSVYDVLRGCSRQLSVSDWWPLQKYFGCLRDLQCVANDNSSDASYLRISSGGLRMSFDTTSGEVPGVITISNVEGNREEESLSGASLIALQQAFQRRIGGIGVVELLSNRSSGEADFIFWNYIGVLPSVTVDAASVVSWHPEMIFYSPGHIGTLSLSSTLSAYMVVPQCNSICHNYLEDCVRGDSLESLRCRYHVLPCVVDTISTGLTWGGIHSDDGTSVEFSSQIRYCSSDDYKPLKWIAQYFGCLARTGCSLNEPKSTEPKVQLVTEPGEQVLTVTGSRIVNFNSPIGFSDPSFESLNAFMQADFLFSLRTQVLRSLATVAMVAEELTESTGQLTLTYSDYLGYLPVVFGNSDVTVAKQTPPSLSISSSESIQNSHWTRLETPLSTFNADKSTYCTSCVTNHLINCPVCVSTVLPSLLIMLRDLNSTFSPTLNLTSVFYTCVDTLPESEWIPVAQMLKCFMINGCPVSDTSDPSVRPPSSTTSFLVVLPALITLQLAFDSQLSVTFNSPQAPNHSVGATANNGFTTSLTVDIENRYQNLKQGLATLLPMNGQSPSVVVSERDQRASINLILDVEIQDYFGWLPTFHSSSTGTDTDFGVVVLPTITVQTYGDLSGASITGLLSLLESYVPTPSPASRVPTGPCASCASALYSCDVDAIASGNCTYTTTSSSFVTCLRNSLPPSVFYGIGLKLGVSYGVNATLTKCFGVLQEQDKLVGATSFRDDGWYQANQDLACFEENSCAFGPLTEGLANGFMVQLFSTSATWTFTISGDAFTAVFRSQFGFREMATSSFNETTSDDELKSLVAGILPSAEVSASMKWLDPEIIITVVCRYIYFPDFSLNLDDGGSQATNSARTVSVVAIKTVVLDDTHLDNAR